MSIFGLNPIYQMMLTQSFQTILRSNYFIFVVTASETLWNYEKDQNIEVWRKLGQVSRKRLSQQTLLCNKYFRKNLKIQQRRTRAGNFDVCFYLIFEPLVPQFDLNGRPETRLCSQVVLGFPQYFQISWNPKSLVVWELMGQLAHKAFFTRYQVPFLLWWKEPVPNFVKMPNMHTIAENFSLN